MVWKTPKIVEVPVGMIDGGGLPAVTMFSFRGLRATSAATSEMLKSPQGEWVSRRRSG